MKRLLCGYPPRLFGFVIAVSVIGIPIVAAAGFRLATSELDLHKIVGATVFFACALASELKPVSLDVEGKRVVSLAFIFIVSAQVLFGWEYGAAVGVIAILIAQLSDKVYGFRMIFNCAVYAIGTGVGSLLSFTHLGDAGSGGAAFGGLTGIVFAEGAVFILLNVISVCAAIAFSEGSKFRPVLFDHLRHSGPAFAVMSSMAALAVALWTMYPPLILLMLGPLLTLGLYQRYAKSTRVAWHAAETDWLTALGNRRAFEQVIHNAVKDSKPTEPATLCIIDIDDFKGINDTHGHEAGDEALARVAAYFAALEDVQAFRLGGDEFALVILDTSEVASERVQSVQDRLAATEEGPTITISAGIATCPESTDDEDELVRLADRALYWTKKNGKGRWCIYSPSVVELSWLADVATQAEYEARLRAAENLVQLVDARSLGGSGHAEGVGELAEAIGIQLELDPETLKRLVLAARLHDLGKIGIPDKIVHKAGLLTDEEREIMEQHPQIAYSLLEGLGIAPIDEWILHHHENWDGTGYGSGLKGEEIPLGARIIHVAEAYHVMTSDRAYSGRLSPEAALAELQRDSGTSFDPAVVDALAAIAPQAWGLEAVSA
jgi:diguanylate cyclase (GGDEF)-like protein